MLKHCKSCRQDLQESKYSNGRKTCDECLVKRKKRTKITLDMCKQVAISKGGECLSTEFKNANATMEWKCSEGHQWKTKFSHIKNGTWCKKCLVISQKLTIEECREYAQNKGGECLSVEYNDVKTKMIWRCSINHEWESVFNNIKTNGSWCPNCAGLARLNIDQCQEKANSMGGKCLSTKYIDNSTKMQWECNKGHRWKACFSSIKNNNTWCQMCAGKSQHTLQKCQEKANSMGGKCLSTEYINTHSKLQWECDKGHLWKACFSGIKNRGQWCPSCAGSRSERMCREIIEKYLLEPFPTKKPKWLEGLELDGYNEELNIAFEYNGKQHYEYMPHFHRNGEEDFESQKARDRKKYRICRERKINLIIIPYQYDYTTPDELDDFIFTELCKIC